jgi:hypothetical protein
MRGVGRDRVVGVAPRLEVGRRRHPVVAEWRPFAALRAVGVRRGGDQLADPGGRAERDRTRDETAEAETEQIGLGDPQLVEQRDNVTGQRLDRHRGPGSAVCPWPCSSTAITCLPAARVRATARNSGRWSAGRRGAGPAAGTMRLVVELQAIHRCVCHAWFLTARDLKR